MKALWLRMVMCAPMYLFEHHLACDLVSYDIGVFNGIPFGVFRCDLMVFPRNSMGIFLFQRVLGEIFPGVDCSFSL